MELPGSKLDWNSLHLLLVLGEFGEVQAAAKYFKVDPTTITRRLKRLESDIGVKLIERIRGGVVFSKSAERFIDAAKKLEADLASAVQETEAVSLSGTIRISMLDFVADIIMPELAKFQSDNPEVRLEIRESYSEDKIERGETDIAVRLSGNPNQGLVGRRVANVTMSVFGVQELGVYLKNQAWISWSLRAGRQRNDAWITSISEGARITSRTDSLVSQARLAAEGVGIAALPDALVRSDPRFARLQKIQSGWSEELWVLTHSELRHVPRINAATKLISDALRTNIGE